MFMGGEGWGGEGEGGGGGGGGLSSCCGAPGELTAEQVVLPAAPSRALRSASAGSAPCRRLRWLLLLLLLLPAMLLPARLHPTHSHMRKRVLAAPPSQSAVITSRNLSSTLTNFFAAR